MRYIGSVKKNNYFENNGINGGINERIYEDENAEKVYPSERVQSEKAVFPPGSIIPDKVRESAENFEEYKGNFDISELFGGGEVLSREREVQGGKTLKNGGVYEYNGEKNLIGDFLRMHMGERVYAEFLFGADTYAKKSGILTGVGINYIIIRLDSGEDVLCDLTDIKFITFE